jgi:hypothetical protein
MSEGGAGSEAGGTGEGWGDGWDSAGTIGVDGVSANSIGGQAGVSVSEQIAGAASTDMGLSSPVGLAPADGASRGTLGDSSPGGEPGGRGGPPGDVKPGPDKPTPSSVLEAARSNDFEVRKQLFDRRAASAGVTKNDNEASLLGFVRPKRKDAVRTLLGP